MKKIFKAVLEIMYMALMCYWFLADNICGVCSMGFLLLFVEMSMVEDEVL